MTMGAVLGRVLPLGCGIYSVVDCQPPYPVFYVDPGSKDEGSPMQTILHPHKARFDDWIEGQDLWSEVWG